MPRREKRRIELSQPDRDWLAGLFDGEAYIGSSGRNVAAIELAMTDQDVVQRAADLVGVAIYERRYLLPRQTQWRMAIYGAAAIQVLEQLYPLLCYRRQERVAPFLASRPTYRLADTTEWLAGLMEAEGSFFRSSRNYPVCSISMVDEDLIDRVAACIGSHYRVQKKGLRRQTQYVCRVDRVSAVTVMQRIYPLMGVRRREQIETALRDYAPLGRVVGERHGRATITNDDVREIYRRAHAGESTSALAREFGIRPSLVSSIKTGRTWKEITGHK